MDFAISIDSRDIHQRLRRYRFTLPFLEAPYPVAMRVKVLTETAKNGSQVRHGVFPANMQSLLGELLVYNLSVYRFPWFLKYSNGS